MVAHEEDEEVIAIEEDVVVRWMSLMHILQENGSYPRKLLLLA